MSLLVPWFIGSFREWMVDWDTTDSTTESAASENTDSLSVVSGTSN